MDITEYISIEDFDFDGCYEYLKARGYDSHDKLALIRYDVSNYVKAEFCNKCGIDRIGVAAVINLTPYIDKIAEIMKELIIDRLG